LPVYSYRALSAGGRLVNGTESATSPKAAKVELLRRGFHLIDVSADVLPPPSRRTRFTGRNRNADVADAVRYLATLVEAELPLDAALQLAADAASRHDVRG